MTHVIGLTGSIGMGKTTTAQMFANRGIPVWDADQAVHTLYATGGAAVAPLSRMFPEAINAGAVDRSALKTIIQKDPTALAKVEKIVHPLVQESREKFISDATSPIVVVDIPLLFETGSETQFDTTVCVSVSAESQKKRVLERKTMSVELFEKILEKQMPDHEKRARSDFVIETNSLEDAQTSVDIILETIRQGQSDA